MTPRIVATSAQLPLPPGAPRGDVLVVENRWGTYIDSKDFKIPGKPTTGAMALQILKRL